MIVSICLFFIRFYSQNQDAKGGNAWPETLANLYFVNGFRSGNSRMGLGFEPGTLRLCVRVEPFRPRRP